MSVFCKALPCAAPWHQTVGTRRDQNPASQGRAAREPPEGGSTTGLVTSDDQARLRLPEEAVDLDARNTHPLELHKLVNGNTAPLVEREARDISESDTSLRVVFGKVPST